MVYSKGRYFDHFGSNTPFEGVQSGRGRDKNPIYDQLRQVFANFGG